MNDHAAGITAAAACGKHDAAANMAVRVNFSVENARVRQTGDDAAQCPSQRPAWLRRAEAWTNRRICRALAFSGYEAIDPANLRKPVLQCFSTQPDALRALLYSVSARQ